MDFFVQFVCTLLTLGKTKNPISIDEDRVIPKALTKRLDGLYAYIWELSHYQWYSEVYFVSFIYSPISLCSSPA